MNEASQSDYCGLLVIGDPHIEGRQPGFRKDDFPRVILDKVKWCLDYANQNRLLPTFLGDLFDKPRDNPNWVIGELIEMFSESGAIGVYGNHDCADPELNENDTLSILVKADCLRLVSETSPWVGRMNDRPVCVGGSSYRHPVPERFELPWHIEEQDHSTDTPPFVVWLTHHDVIITGYDSGRFKPFEIDGVGLLINGHIHRRLETVVTGQTTWMTPGSIVRRTRSEANRDHVPQVLRIDVQADSETISDVVVPHQPFDEVFHAEVIDAAGSLELSGVVSGLAELMARRTESGAGLQQFLDQNLDQFEPAITAEIRKLANETMKTES